MWHRIKYVNKNVFCLWQTINRHRMAEWKNCGVKFERWEKAVKLKVACIKNTFKFSNTMLLILNCLTKFYFLFSGFLNFFCCNIQTILCTARARIPTQDLLATSEEVSFFCSSWTQERFTSNLMLSVYIKCSTIYLLEKAR